MTGTEVVLAAVVVLLAVAFVVQSRSHASTVKMLLDQFRAQARQDHLAATAANAREFMYAEGLGREAEQIRRADAVRSEPEPPLVGMG